MRIGNEQGQRRPLFLASVRSVEEAFVCSENGADIIDCKDPSAGVLGAVEPGIVRAIRAAVRADIAVSATIGDVPAEAGLTCGRIMEFADSGADYVKIGIFPGGSAETTIRAAGELQVTSRLVAVLFAEDGPDYGLVAELARARFAGVLLDTRTKGGGSLLDMLPLRQLAMFVLQSRAAGLFSGLAGSLTLNDIAEAAACDPDVLGFRGALCIEGRRTNSIDADAIAAVAATLAKKVPLRQRRRA